MSAHDIVERGLGGKAERLCPPCIEITRPTGDDANDRRIGLAADELHRPFAAEAAQRLDLLADGCREAWHVEASPRPERSQINGRRMHEEANCGARARKPVPHVFGHRKHRFLPGERLPQDIGKEARCRLVWRAWAHANRRQAQSDPVEEAAAAVVGKQEFGYRLLSAVARERGGDELIADLLW